MFTPRPTDCILLLHIRGYFQRYALYKSTFYLLTYLLQYTMQCRWLCSYESRHESNVKQFALFLSENKS